MQNTSIRLGDIELDASEITKYWVDDESAQALKTRQYYQDNNYLASSFGLLFAGVVSTLLRKRAKQAAPAQYLHIETRQRGPFCFAADQIDLAGVLSQLKQKSPQG